MTTQGGDRLTRHCNRPRREPSEHEHARRRAYCSRAGATVRFRGNPGNAVNAKDIASLADKLSRGAAQANGYRLSRSGSYESFRGRLLQGPVRRARDELTRDGQDRIAAGRRDCALPQQYEPLKLSGPVFAGIYQSGVKPSGTVFEKGWPLKPGIECEMVARLAQDVDGGQPAVHCRNHQAVCLGLLLRRRGDREPLRRPRQGERPGPNRRRRTASRLHRRRGQDWQTVDFAALKGRSMFQDKEIGAGPGINVMGSALIALAWVANKLIEHGKHLHAGDVVLTGTVHPPVFLPGPGGARTEFIGFGGTEITIS